MGCHISVSMVGCACQSAAAQRILVHPLHAVLEAGQVSCKHHSIGQKVMGKTDRLCSLKVGVPRHYSLLVFRSLFSNGFQHFLDQI